MYTTEIQPQITSKNFDQNVVPDVGIEAAIILENILFWVCKNQANERHFYDGRYWTYNSKKAFQTLFSYLTEKQIRLALDKLREKEYLIIGEYNKNKNDRTLWYSISDEYAQKRQFRVSEATSPNGPMEQTEKANGADRKGQPIPVYKPDYKPQILEKTYNKEPGEDTSSEDVSDLFNRRKTQSRPKGFRDFKSQDTKEEKPRYKFHKRPSAIFVEKDY